MKDGISRENRVRELSVLFAQLPVNLKPLKNELY